MKIHPSLLAASSLLLLAACQPGAAEYTAAEAPKQLTLDNATSSIAVRFAPGSSRLARADAARLRWLVASGHIMPSDRIMVAAGGAPNLAAARFAAVSTELMRYGIAPVPVSLAAVPRNGGIIEIGRYMVSLPNCPNWSKPANQDYANTVDSNYGCANAVNLGRMIASPYDLAEGRPLGPTPALKTVSALERYYADSVYLSPSISLITSLGNANLIPPGTQTKSASQSSIFTETSPNGNPIAGSAAGGGGGAANITRPSVTAPSTSSGTPAAPVPPGSVPPAGR